MNYRTAWSVLAALIMLVAPRSAPAQDVELRLSLRKPPEHPSAPLLNDDMHKAPEVLLASPFTSSSGTPGFTIANIHELLTPAQ